MTTQPSELNHGAKIGWERHAVSEQATTHYYIHYQLQHRVPGKRLAYIAAGSCMPADVEFSVWIEVMDDVLL